MFEPWSFNGSHGYGPCAVRTALGLVIRGLSEVASRISLCRLEETLSKQNNHAFNRKSYMVEGEMEKKLAELKFEEEAELKRKKWRKQREKVRQRRREVENKAQRKKVKLKRKEIVAWLIKRVPEAKAGKKRRNLKPGDIVVRMDPGPQGSCHSDE
ncbi:hypothetical protein VZT92_000378 [Zoarces viviparus]|uniref:Uncharacterized protein n=1 Tax=Zoarces viviparus TaxID=48416 RepID=A0AAW1G862_ZOAVI